MQTKWEHNTILVIFFFYYILQSRKVLTDYFCESKSSNLIRKQEQRYILFCVCVLLKECGTKGTLLKSTYECTIFFYSLRFLAPTFFLRVVR